LKLTNDSCYAGRIGDTDRWDWTTYLDADQDELANIEYVEYHLVPGFPNPIRRVKNPQGGFALKSNGWGTFEIKAKVYFKDKRKPKILKHYLVFEGAEDA